MTPRRFGVVLAAATLLALMDAINSTLMMVNRAHFAGGVHATLDEAAWINIAYFAAKLSGFVLAGNVSRRFGMRRVLCVSAVVLLAATLMASLSMSLPLLCTCRALHGFAGALVLSTAQAVLLNDASPRYAAVGQAVFALATVMAPTTVAPFIQGWITDEWSYRWVFLAGVPFGAVGLGLLLYTGRPGADVPDPAMSPGIRPIDIVLLMVATTSAVLVLQEGNRHDWLASPLIVQSGLLALASAGMVAWRQAIVPAPFRWLPARLFRDAHFTFGFCVSFVAGFALFGSAFLLPAFAQSVLGRSPMHAGALLLSGGVTASLGLLLGGALAQYTRVPPLKLIPAGILLFMLAMSMLAYTSILSGPSDMNAPLLIRGFGLGLMFISLTLVTLGALPADLACHGAALFNFGRQAGGLLGIAFLQTYLHHRHGAARLSLVQTLPTGAEVPLPPAVGASPLHDELANADPAIALGAVLEMLVERQAGALAFNAAFLSLTLLFVVAVPVLIAIKVALGRRAKRA